jgi:hypothetical protein
MAKVFGIHKVALRPGVKGEDFESFVRTSMPQLTISAGMKVRLLKGDRGDRDGKYLVLFEFDSVEVRDREAPLDASASPEAEAAAGTEDPAFAQFAAQWLRFCFAVADPTFTDYVVVAE